jgi:hypothetical protein
LTWIHRDKGANLFYASPERAGLFSLAQAGGSGPGPNGPISTNQLKNLSFLYDDSRDVAGQYVCKIISFPDNEIFLAFH